MFMIARPINGISINGNEYASNPDTGENLKFASEQEAKDYLYKMVDKKFRKNIDADLDSGALQIVEEESDNDGSDF